MAEIEEKLRVIMDDRIEKLTLSSGIPLTVEELKSVVKETFGITQEFCLHYLDSEFGDYFTLNSCDQIKHKDTIKVVHTCPVVLTLIPTDESFASTSDKLSTSGTSFAETTTTNLESSTESSSSADTTILPKQNLERFQSWPKIFPIPQFAFETEMFLHNATEEYNKSGTFPKTAKVKGDILEKLAEAIYAFTAYPSNAQISDVAEILVKTYPCLREPGSYSGFYGWQQSIKYKMANYRTKLRGFGIPEVMCNSIKNKSPANRKSAKAVKKPRKAEVNYLPPYPPGEDEESLEQERILLLTEVMKRDNAMVIKDMMARTFPHRRNDVIIKSLGIEDLKSRWPALFEPCHVS